MRKPDCYRKEDQEITNKIKMNLAINVFFFKKKKEMYLFLPPYGLRAYVKRFPRDSFSSLHIFFFFLFFHFNSAVQILSKFNKLIMKERLQKDILKVYKKNNEAHVNIPFFLFIIMSLILKRNCQLKKTWTKTGTL